MPEEGMKWLPKTEILSFEEIERIARVMVEHFGIDSIRLTGGEPTVRAHLPILVAKLAALPVDLALTTNGATLRASAHDLKAAGLERINISLDTFRADRFLEITRRDELARVLDGIDAAIEAQLHPIKINVVVMRGVNDDELLDFATFGREKNVEIRFIEFMPLEAGHWWTNESVVPFDEIVARVNDIYPCEPVAHGHEPAARFRYRDGHGSVRCHRQRHQSVLRIVRSRAVSPPTASSATACSPSKNTICAPRCDRARPTTRSRARSSRPCTRSGPAIRSTTCTSSGRNGR